MEDHERLTGPPFPAAETYLLRRAKDDLECLEIAEWGSHMLGRLLSGLRLPPSDGEPDLERERVRALLYLGVLAARSLRVEMILFRVGYGPEALILHRRLTEIYGRVTRIADPTNGAQRAVEWLRGGDMKPRRVVEIDDAFWDYLSRSAHADYRAVENHLLRPREDGLPDFVMLPLRVVEEANATLVLDACQVRDIATLIGRVVKLPIDDLARFDATARPLARKWIGEPTDT